MGVIRKAFKVKNTVRHPIRSATRSVKRSAYKAVVPKSVRKASYKAKSVSTSIHHPVSSAIRALDSGPTTAQLAYQRKRKEAAEFRSRQATNEKLCRDTYRYSKKDQKTRAHSSDYADSYAADTSLSSTSMVDDWDNRPECTCRICKDEAGPGHRHEIYGPLCYCDDPHDIRKKAAIAAEMNRRAQEETARAAQIRAIIDAQQRKRTEDAIANAIFCTLCVCAIIGFFVLASFLA